MTHPRHELQFRQLTRDDMPALSALCRVIEADLPDPEWYYVMEDEGFAVCCDRGETYGFWDGDRLAAFAILTPGPVRGESSYAGRLGCPVETSYDFQDVMVDPAYRRRGLHTAFIDAFAEMARAAGGTAMYCTVSPKNLPSKRSFERSGFELLVEKPAYQGWTRGYYRKTL